MPPEPSPPAVPETLDAPGAGAPPALIGAALAQLTEGVIVAGADGRIQLVNDAAARLHGVARLDVGVEDYAAAYRLFTEDGRPYPSAELPLARAVLCGETVVNARWRIRRPDGSEVLAVGSARPVVGPDGERQGAVLTFRDDTARAAAERAEGRAAQILERTGDAHVAFDRELRYVAVNAAGERSMGRPRGALLGRTLLEAFPDAAGSESERHYLRVLAEGVTVHFAEHYVGDGLDNHVEVNAYPTEDGGVAVFWREVTARARAEAALRASEAKYRALFESLDVGLCIIEVLFDSTGRAHDYRFLEANPAFIEQTGLPGAVGRTMRELASAHESHWFEIYGRVALTGEPTRFEAPAEALGRWYDVFAFRVGAPEERRVAVLFNDVLAAKLAERERERLLAELRAANEELQRLNAEARRAERRARFLADLGVALQPLAEPDAVMATTARLLGQHLGVNRCAYAEVEDDEDHFVITGNYTRGDTISIVGRFSFTAFGAECLRLMRADQAYVVADALTDPRVTAPDRAAYEQTQIRAVICVPLHKAGRFVAAMAVHQRVPRGWTPDEVALVVTVVHRCWESLERARAYRSLREREATLRATSAQLAERTAAAEVAQGSAETAQQAAEAANRAKSEFLAVMSHELRTPLNAIGGYAELMEMGIRGPVTAQQAEDLRRVQASQRHLLGLVNEVLNYARIETGTVHYDVADVPLTAAVASVEPLVAPQLAAKGLEFAVDACDPAPVARADGEKLRQVLLNLLSNAIKFTDAPGRVEVACEAAGERVVVRVRDTGIGIAQEELGQIFEPFVQVNARLTRTREGTGLGLAISRDLARGMGGDLTVESAPGLGSAFTLTLPAAR